MGEAPNPALVESVRNDLDRAGIRGWRAFYAVICGKWPPDDWRPPHWSGEEIRRQAEMEIPNG